MIYNQNKIKRAIRLQILFGAVKLTYNVITAATKSNGIALNSLDGLTRNKCRYVLHV